MLMFLAQTSSEKLHLQAGWPSLSLRERGLGVCRHPSNTNLFINSSGLTYVVNLDGVQPPLLSRNLTHVDLQAQRLQRIAWGGGSDVTTGFYIAGSPHTYG